MRWPVLLALLAMLVPAPPAGSAERAGSAEPTGSSTPATDPPARPRIGLVLSGGGARGAAHIGVIAALEELRIPVDVVTGTSMGSIIGGLYALGRSPDEMEAAVARIDWVDVFRDDGGRDGFSFRRKQDDFNFLTSLRLGFRDGSLFIPAGLIEGQKLDFWLRVLTLTERGSADFAALRLPFAAVATDVETGEAVVLERGDLATALRASMSIPGAFAPVDLEGRRLVDGGTVNNLPVDLAQARGADVVIAVDISTPLYGAEELVSAVDISSQILGIPIQQNQDRQLERLGERDVVVRPDLGAVGATSFTALDAAIEAGRESALAMRAQLEALALPEDAYRAWQERHRRPQPELPTVSAIEIENGSALDDGVVASLMRTTPGLPLDLDVLAADLARIYGTDAFDLVRFDLAGPDGRTLHVRATPRARGVHHLRLGVTLATDFSRDSTFSIATNHVAYPLDRYGREWRTRLQLGHAIALGTEIFQPLGVAQRFFVTPSFDYERSQTAYFDTGKAADRNEIGRFASDVTQLGFETGINLSNVARIQGGLGYVFARHERESGNPADQLPGGLLPPDENAEGGAVLFSVDYDTLDDTGFPNSGSIARVAGLLLERPLGWGTTTRRVEVGYRGFRTFGRDTIGIGVDYVSLFGVEAGNVRPVFQPSLGGFANLGGFREGSIRGESAVQGSLSLYRRIASPVVFAWDFPVYVGAIAEVGSAWDGRREDIPDGVDPLLWSTTAFAGAETPLGPLYVAYAYGEGGSHRGYLFLGQAF